MDNPLLPLNNDGTVDLAEMQKRIDAVGATLNSVTEDAITTSEPSAIRRLAKSVNREVEKTLWEALYEDYSYVYVCHSLSLDSAGFKTFKSNSEEPPVDPREYNVQRYDLRYYTPSGIRELIEND